MFISGDFYPGEKQSTERKHEDGGAVLLPPPLLRGRAYADLLHIAE